MSRPGVDPSTSCCPGVHLENHSTAPFQLAFYQVSATLILDRQLLPSSCNFGLAAFINTLYFKGLKCPFALAKVRAKKPARPESGQLHVFLSTTPRNTLSQKS